MIITEKDWEKILFGGTISKTKTFEDTKDFVADRIQQLLEKKYYPFIIVDNDVNEIAGFIDIKNIDWRIPKGELGYYVDEKVCGYRHCY